jgi:hypothetical protein
VGTAAWYGARPPTPYDQSDSSQSASQESVVRVPQNGGGWVAPGFDEAVQVRPKTRCVTLKWLTFLLICTVLQGGFLDLELENLKKTSPKAWRIMRNPWPRPRSGRTS